MSAARADAAARLAARLGEAGARARATGRPVLVSVVTPAPAADPLRVLERVAGEAGDDPALAAQLAADRVYWTRPADGVAFAAVGAVATLTPAGPGRFAAADRAWAGLLDGAIIDDPSGGAAGAGPLLAGGFAFDPEGPRAAHWRGFPSALLTLPRLQLALVRGACWATVTALVGADGTPDVAPALLDRLRARLVAPAGDAPPDPGAAPPDEGGDVAFADALPAVAWRARVAEAVAAIRAGALDKVVLARAVRAAAGRDFDVPAALRHLRAAYPDCRVFGVWRGDAAFVGASPERLVRLDGREVQASSLAGSAPRGPSRGEDAALAGALLASAKDRAEHALVRQALVAGLAELCDAVDAAPEPSLLTLAHVHHLHTAVRARLRAGHSLLDVVARLHPTPAVGGAPREAALRFLREREQLDRGWYAAPVGWVGRDGGELAVGLRSALVRRDEAWLFAGCGIVADSDPDVEYAESLLKLRPMELALAASLGARAGEEPVAAASGGGRGR